MSDPNQAAAAEEEEDSMISALFSSIDTLTDPSTLHHHHHQQYTTFTTNSQYPFRHLANQHIRGLNQPPTGTSIPFSTPGISSRSPTHSLSPKSSPNITMNHSSGLAHPVTHSTQHVPFAHPAQFRPNSSSYQTHPPPPPRSSTPSSSRQSSPQHFPSQSAPDQNLMSSLRSMLTKEGERELASMYYDYQQNRVTAEHFTRRARELMGDDVYHRLTAGATTAFTHLSSQQQLHPNSRTKRSAMFDIVIDPRTSLPSSKRAKLVPESTQHSIYNPYVMKSPFGTADGFLQNPYRSKVATSEQVVCNVPSLQVRVQELVAYMGLTNVSESAVKYLACALQQHLQSIMHLALTYAENRTCTMNVKDLQRLATNPCSNSSSFLPLTLSTLQSNRPYAFDIEITSNPALALDVVRVREDKVSQRESLLYQPRNATSEPGSTSLVADKDPTNTDNTLLPPVPQPDIELSYATPNLPGRTPSAASSSATTAFLAAGGSAKSWMTMGPPTEPIVPVKRRNLASRSSAKDHQSSLAVPGMGNSSALQFLGVRDVLLALQTGPDALNCGHNKRGIGKVCGRYWAILE